MKSIINQSYEGERPLFAQNALRLEHVRILPGESALKECRHIEALHCEFNGKYPFWHNSHIRIENCLFKEGGRAAIWYSRDIHMLHTLVEAPKMFRDADGVKLDHVSLPHAAECLWNCRNVEMLDVRADEGDYLMMHGSHIRADRFVLNGNYSFQYCKNVEIRHAEIHSKDAFWNSENVTIYDSVLDGEYLGWHTTNLRLINCRISGTQPLCYAANLILENCTFAPDADLCFEHSTLYADIRGAVHSVKNPSGGYVLADHYGEIILDDNLKSPGDCRIETRPEESDDSTWIGAA